VKISVAFQQIFMKF